MVNFRIECELVFPREDFWQLRATRGFLRFVVEDGMLKKMEADQIHDECNGWFRREFVYIPANIDCSAIVRAVIGDRLFEVHDTQRWCPEKPFRLSFKTHPSILSGLVRTDGEMELFETGDVGSSIGGGSSSEEGSEEEESTISPPDHVVESCADDVDKISTTHDISCKSVEEYTSREQDERSSVEDDLDRMCKLVPQNERCTHVVTGEVRVAIVTVGWFVEKAIVHNLKLFYRDYPKTVARFRQWLVNEFAMGDSRVPISDVVKRYLAAEKADVQQRMTSDSLTKGILVSHAAPDRTMKPHRFDPEQEDCSSEIHSSEDERQELDDAIQEMDDAELIDL